MQLLGGNCFYLINIYFPSQKKLSCFSYSILSSIFITSLVDLMSATEIDFIDDKRKSAIDLDFAKENEMRRFKAASCACFERRRSSACILLRYNDYFKQPTRRRIQSTFLGKCAFCPLATTTVPWRYEDDPSNYSCLVIFFSLCRFSFHLICYFYVYIIENTQYISKSCFYMIYMIHCYISTLHFISFLYTNFLSISSQFKRDTNLAFYMEKWMKSRLVRLLSAQN